MKKRRKLDPDMPIGKLVEVEDFLPPPDQIVFTKNKEKVTIELTKSTLDFFKFIAKKNHTKYQTMIRELLDKYVSHYR